MGGFMSVAILDQARRRTSFLLLVTPYASGLRHRHLNWGGINSAAAAARMNTESTDAGHGPARQEDPLEELKKFGEL
jgi:hypothetical protein